MLEAMSQIGRVLGIALIPVGAYVHYGLNNAEAYSTSSAGYPVVSNSVQDTGASKSSTACCCDAFINTGITKQNAQLKTCADSCACSVGLKSKANAAFKTIKNSAIKVIK